MGVVMGVAMGGESVVVMGGRTGGDSGADAGNGGQEAGKCAFLDGIIEDSCEVVYLGLGNEGGTEPRQL